MRHLRRSYILASLFFLIVPFTMSASSSQVALSADSGTAFQNADSGAESVIMSSCTDQLKNGSFETGTFMYWTIGGSPQVTTGGHTGLHSALLGGSDNDYDEISQEVVCPYYGDKVIAHAWVYMSTNDWEEWADWLQLAAYDTRGAGGYSYFYNNNTPEEWGEWTFSSQGPGACEPGVTWTVRNRAETDEGLPTTFIVDDVSLEVCCPDDTYEPNDSFNAARSVSPGDYNVWLCPNYDEDWFQFNALAGEIITTDLTNAGLLDGNLCLYRPDGSQAACSTNPGAVTEHIEHVANQAGSWRVRVYDPTGGTSTAASMLHIVTTAIPPIPPGCFNILDNGGFETGSMSPWGKDGPADVLQPGRESLFHAWLGGYDNAEAEIFQWIDVPNGITSAPFIFWWRADAESEQPDDTLLVLVQYSNQTDQVYTEQAVAPLGLWHYAQVDLKKYAGMQVLITFHAHTNATIPTTFRVDDSALLACGLPYNTFYLPVILMNK